MEFMDSQIVGGIIGLGLVVKGFAEIMVKRNGKSDPRVMCTKCNVSESFEGDSKRHWQDCRVLLTEILAILHERK